METPENLTPEKIRSIFNASLTALTRKHYRDAILGFEKFLEYNPNSAEAYLNLGNAHFYMENIDEAIDNFEKSIKIDPVIFNAYLNLGNCYYKRSQYDEAISCWSVAANINPQKTTVHQNIAAAYEKIGNHIKAYQHYELFLKYNKKNDKTAMLIQRKVEENRKAAFHNLNVGITLQQRKMFGKAIGAFSKSISIYPNFSKAHINLGSIFYTNEKLDAAIDCWKTALILEPDHANTHCNLGIAYDKQKEPEMACYHYLMYIKFTQGKAKDAEEVKKRIDEIQKTLKDNRELIRKHLNKGDEFFSLKKYQDALNEYYIYLTINPNASDIQSVKERIEEASVRLNPLKKALEVALKMGDDFYAAAKYDKALAAYNRYIMLDPCGVKASEVKKQIDKFVKHKPEAVAQLLRNWLADDWN